MITSITPSLFPDLPDDSRAWLYAAVEPVDADRQAMVLAFLEPTITKWKSHGAIVPAYAAFLDEVTLLVAADFTGAEMSGCSIDRMVGSVREAGVSVGVELVDTPRGVHHWSADGLRFSSREEFGDLVRNNLADGGTAVLDLTVITLGAVRAGRWKRPAKEGWHAKAFSF
jgi:hypothetical protein